MSRPTYARALVALGLAVGAVTACSSAPSPTPPSPTSSSAPPTASTPATTRAAGDNPVVALCGPPGVGGVHALELEGPGGSTLPGLLLGHGKTAAIFLHQTDGSLCGWLPYAKWLVDRYPVQAVLFDLCRFGAARCPDAAFQADQIRQVALAVTWARRHGATRVVLVGASMGGALALEGGPALHADALVDLSGPADWPGAVAATVAPTVRIPALIAASPTDSGIGYGSLRAAFATIPAAAKRFVVGTGPHGWALLGDPQQSPPVWTPLATTVAQWITGSYG